jgi:serine/threonine protein phosphatase PrpC
VNACPTCGEPIAADDQFCESCGATLTEGAVVAAPAEAESGTQTFLPRTQSIPAVTVTRRCSCGGEIDADGWCTTCGLRAASERDHSTEQAAHNVAAVCDKGRVHPRNEDAMALAASRDRIVLVVCDGVTSTTDSDVASLAAACAARDVLDQTPISPSRAPAALVELWTDALERSVAAAQEQAAAAAVTVGATENPPSCTFVAAVVDGPVLVSGWVGDSRCYWFGNDGTSVQVSVDDSWASTEIARGTDRAVAELDPRAHSITRWLGVDAPIGPPSCASVPIGSGGWVVVCSDGLWNYCSMARDLSELLQDVVARVGNEPLAVASALCDWANEQGGHDNVTVALAHLTAAPTPEAPQTDAPEAEAPAAEPAAEQPA